MIRGLKFAIAIIALVLSGAGGHKLYETHYHPLKHT